MKTTAPPATFRAHGKDWFPHTPGDPMPVGEDALIFTLWRMELEKAPPYFSPTTTHASAWRKQRRDPDHEIIGWRYADPQRHRELETLRADVAPLLGVIQSVFAADSNAEIFGKLKELRRSFEEFTEKHPTLKLSAK